MPKIVTTKQIFIQTPPPLFSTGMLRLVLPFTEVGASATSLRLPQILRSRRINKTNGSRKTDLPQ